MRDIIINELATRIYDLDPYDAHDTDTTVDDIISQIDGDPLPIINYLLNIVEEATA